MKTVRRFASSILAAGLLAGSPVALFAADPPSTQPAPESKLVTDTPADARVRQAISAIENAPNPSAVVEAYASAAQKDSVPLKQAYVKRLAALGIPELAETQARELIQRGPDDGTAWAVVAFMDARRNNTPAAINDIVIAARHAPDDPFVERTAAQIIAYYDVHPDQGKSDDALRGSVADVLRSLMAKPIFLAAYQHAKLVHAQAAAGLTPPAATHTAEAVAPPVGPYSVGPTTVYNNTYLATETDPFAYDAGVQYPWWPSAWWWSPGIVIVDGPFDHDRFDHRFDGRDEHGFDDRRGRDFDEGGRSSDEARSGGSPGMMRGMPPARSTPPSRRAAPPAPFRSSPGFSGAGGGRSFGSPSFGSPSGGQGGRTGGGGGHGGGGGGGHR